MATEINTFSAAVDAVVERSGRVNLRSSIIAYVRLAIRELQSKVESPNDLVEEELVADAAPFVWTQPEGFRKLVSARYGTVYDLHDNAVYPKQLVPGNWLNRFDYYYYQSGNSFVFSGIGPGDVVQLAYLKWALNLPYYEPADRPAVYELETSSWTYKAAITADEQEVARSQVTNWILFDWFDLVVEGALAKLYKTVGDERAVSSFALFKSLEQDFKRSASLSDGIGVI